jgi:hypothetical protein
MKITNDIITIMMIWISSNLYLFQLFLRFCCSFLIASSETQFYCSYVRASWLIKIYIMCLYFFTSIAAIAQFLECYSSYRSTCLFKCSKLRYVAAHVGPNAFLWTTAAVNMTPKIYSCYVFYCLDCVTDIFAIL